MNALRNSSNFLKFLTIILVLLHSTMTTAFAEGGNNMRLSVNPKKALIGDPINIIVENAQRDEIVKIRVLQQINLAITGYQKPHTGQTLKE